MTAFGDYSCGVNTMSYGCRAFSRLIPVVRLCLAAPPSLAGSWLTDLTWPEAAQALPEKIVVLPFAAGAKQHGPHLPLGTDARVMQNLLDLAVRERDVVIAPPILHGWFPGFRSYPGTEIADAKVFQAYVESVAESLIASGAKKLVLLNLGISRATGLPLAIVARDLRVKHKVHMLLVSWDDLETDETATIYTQTRGGHADEGETSIMLHLHPEIVQMQRAAADYRDTPREQTGYAPGAFDRASESGVFGDPTLATPAKGSAILAVMQKNWLLALDQFAAR